MWGGGGTHYLTNFSPKLHENKKVLLHERKRHTARRIASTCHAVPAGVPPHPDLGPGWGVSHPADGGIPPLPTILTWDGVLPSPDLERGYPILLIGGVGYPILLTGGYPILLMRVPRGTPLLTWDGVPLPRWPDEGTSLIGVYGQTPVKTLPAPFLRNAGGHEENLAREGVPHASS